MIDRAQTGSTAAGAATGASTGANVQAGSGAMSAASGATIEGASGAILSSSGSSAGAASGSPSDATLPPAPDASDEHAAPASPDASTVDGADDAPHEAAIVESGADASTVPPSCAPGGPGMTDCGPDKESCCTSILVPSGSFDRTYSYKGSLFSGQDPATVSAVRLDKYEVTVGRYRQFLAAYGAGWTPPSGSGKHTHLNGGRGLEDSADAGSYESGWDPAWLTQPTEYGTAVTTRGWTTVLKCGASGWTDAPGATEDWPMSCVNWYAAYAFCIWDGGFLPSEAEWINAAAGGSEERLEPWSVPSSSNAIDCSYADYEQACDDDPFAVGTDSPKGSGRWGHADLVGDVAEYTADFFASELLSPCTDCARLSLPPQTPVLPIGESYDYHLVRGGAWDGIGNASSRQGNCWNADDLNCYEDGIRCARAP